MNIFQKTRSWAFAHKIWSVILIVAVVGGGYYLSKTRASASVTTYTLASATDGTIITTVTGTGQVSANNQADVAAQVSGTVDVINVKVGQVVTAGQSLAHIDSSSAEQSLESAQISYSKLVEPPTSADLENAQNSLAKSYSDGYAAMTTAMNDLLSVKTGLYGELYLSSGFASNTGANANFIHTNGTAQTYWTAADSSYSKALLSFASAYTDFQVSSQNESTSTTKDLLGEAYAAAKDMAIAANNVNALVNFIAGQDTSGKASSAASTAQTSMQTWVSGANGDVSSVLSAENSITSNENSLETLVQGPDSLDLQSQRISLTQAQQNYDYTYVRAPFSGIVAKIDVTPAEQVTSGTTVATVVTPEEFATISLNEIDAAKVAVGQKATLTFDAFSDLSIAGTVSEVDGIGTVSQGVVTYGVKIAFDTNDSRVKPGMSVNATIMTAVHSGVLVVPSSAVKTQGNASYIQELAQKYTAAQGAAGVTSATAPSNVPVTVGLSDTTNTEIDSGLSAGDQVIVKTSVSSGTATKSTATAATTRATGGGGFGGGGAAVLRGL